MPRSCPGHFQLRIIIVVVIGLGLLSGDVAVSSVITHCLVSFSEGVDNDLDEVFGVTKDGLDENEDLKILEHGNYFFVFKFCSPDFFLNFYTPSY